MHLSILISASISPWASKTPSSPLPYSISDLYLNNYLTNWCKTKSLKSLQNNSDLFSQIFEGRLGDKLLLLVESVVGEIFLILFGEDLVLHGKHKQIVDQQDQIPKNVFIPIFVLKDLHDLIFGKIYHFNDALVD